MKKDLLVTLADKNYIEQAKQLFSSVYFNAGWKGDYMLLSYKIPEEELMWFSNKGILVKKCEPLYDEESYLILTITKFYLFTPEFKEWKNIVYLDTDIIAKASLDELTKIKGFAAVPDIFTPKLADQFKSRDEKSKRVLNELKKHYDLKAPAFNAAVMAFHADIIKEDSLSRLKELYETYQDIGIRIDDQNLLNLLFYKKWIKLPLVYNLLAYYVTKNYNVKPEKIKAVILHFSGPRLWDTKGYFYKEWKHNLERAELIDLNKTQIPKIWANKEIKKYSFYFKKRSMIFQLDEHIGLIGIFLKNNFPKLYFILKKAKEWKNRLFQ